MKRWVKIVSGLATVVVALGTGGIVLVHGWLARANAAEVGPPAQVGVTGGTIEGVQRPDGLRVFKGIPFAAPPVGELRWKPPQALPPWTGVRKTTKFAASPLQNKAVALYFSTPWDFSEDCLYLNVWAPAASAGQKLPVMVWLYGGAFQVGSTAIPVYDGSYLAEKGVVVVSVAYRVGVFGFLAHPELATEGASGNFGIRDQIAGLEWVRDNIAAFGGDPRRVTIFGESAGGQSVGLLVTSPKAKGLFQRAIAQSGALGPQKTLATADREGAALLSKLEVKSIAAARALPAATISAANFPSWPSVDETLFASDPYRCVAQGNANTASLLLGFNSDDGELFVKGAKQPAEFEDDVHKTLGTDAEKVLAFYPHATAAEAFRSAKDLVRDAAAAWPVWNWAKLNANQGTDRAFIYVFEQHSTKQPDGAPHAAEIAYVFGNLKNPDAENREVSERMSSYWVNFAQTGDPNGPGLPRWEPFDPAKSESMYLGGTPRMAPILGLARFETFASAIAEFWQNRPGR